MGRKGMRMIEAYHQPYFHLWPSFAISRTNPTRPEIDENRE